jgi:hypothetical protein
MTRDRPNRRAAVPTTCDDYREGERNEDALESHGEGGVHRPCRDSCELSAEGGRARDIASCPPGSIGVREKRVDRVVVWVLRQVRGLQERFQAIAELVRLGQDFVERDAAGAYIKYA